MMNVPYIYPFLFLVFRIMAFSVNELGFLFFFFLLLPRRRRTAVCLRAQRVPSFNISRLETTGQVTRAFLQPSVALRNMQVASSSFFF